VTVGGAPRNLNFVSRLVTTFTLRLSLPLRALDIAWYLSHHKIMMQQRVNRSFENAERLKELGATPIYRNYIHKEMKRRLNSGNACYHSVQILRSPRLLSRNVNIKIHTVIFPVVMYQ
jgi:hypothetical protein